MNWFGTWLLVFTLAGCFGAHREPDSTADGGTDPTVTCGQLTCDQAPANSCVDQDTLLNYSASCENQSCSYHSAEVECGAAGCCGDHCCQATPSNADVFGSLTPTGLVIAPPNGEFNTDTDCTTPSALGACGVVVRDGLNEACVCRMDEVVIDSLKVTGARALVLFASRSVDIATLLDVSAELTSDGPGANRRYAMDAPTNAAYAGAGGSYQTWGGLANNSATSVAASYGEPTLVPLLGGMRGQASSAEGGGGGGAVQITAGARISVPGTINAGGGGGVGGHASYSISGAGGGGSGGGILLEAPAITVTGAIVANGGGGGGGGGTHGSGGNGGTGGIAGGDGGDGRDGAGCPLYGYVSGGNGGSGGIGSNPGLAGSVGEYFDQCINAVSFVGNGGGGGGVGRIRVNTKSGCQCNGTFSPSATFGTLSPQ